MRRTSLLVSLSLLFLVLFAGALEGVVRLLELGSPRLRSLPLPAELAGLLRSDEDLFWTLAPNVEVEYRGAVVRTSSQGLRSPEVAEKRNGELRVLSLGESGAFGIGVANEETFAARLEALLREREPSRLVTVINAAVPAWSSFQSRLYFELHGAAFQPDVVLLYHEMNDYLPASLRDSSSTEAEMVRSDLELYHSRRGALWRLLLDRSAVFRFVSYRVAERKLRDLEAEGGFVSPYDIGLPQIGVTPRIRRAAPGEFGLAGIEERNLPTRVRPEEREGILEELLALSESRGIRLIVIHPTYYLSTAHECTLTRFCGRRGVTMLEAYDVLHPAGELLEGTFRDHGHPSVLGHERLAAALVELLEQEGLLSPP